MTVLNQGMHRRLPKEKCYSFVAIGQEILCKTCMSDPILTILIIQISSLKQDSLTSIFQSILELKAFKIRTCAFSCLFKKGGVALKG